MGKRSQTDLTIPAGRNTRSCHKENVNQLSRICVTNVVVYVTMTLLLRFGVGVTDDHKIVKNVSKKSTMVFGGVNKKQPCY